MSSSPTESFTRNMTEVLFPNQPLDTRTPDYLASADWFLPPNNYNSGNKLHGALQGAAADNAKQSPSFTNTPPPSSTPQSRDEPFPSQQLSQSTFKGLEEHMSQGNHPFENLSSNHIPQTILSSNVRPSTSSQTQQPPSHQQSPTPRSFAPIAPDPVGLQRMQAVRQNQEVEEHQQPKRRRLTQSSMDAPQPPPLKDEDKLLLQLKDEQQLPWKNIVGSFQQETGKVHAIAALQMRYKRLKDRLQVWTDPDIEALKQAHDYWESRKFDIISAKMLEFGATEKFSALACRRKWQELHPTAEYPLHQVPIMPGGGSGGGGGAGTAPPAFTHSSSSPQPSSHPTSYPSMPSSYHLPQPQGGSVYGSLPSQSSLASPSPMHAHASYPPPPPPPPPPSHTQPAYTQPTYGSYAPVSQSQQPQAPYRQSPPQAGPHPHPPPQPGYTTPSPQQRFSSYPPSGAPHGGQQGPSGPGAYWH